MKLRVWHERRVLMIDGRLDKKAAMRLLEGGAPNLSYEIDGQEPCVFTEGEQIVLDPHRFWITISKVRPKAGRWQIEYVLADHRPRYMGKQTGYTSNPAKAMKADYYDPEGTKYGELESVEVDRRHPEDERRETTQRLKRTKLEDLRAERAAQARRLASTKSAISRRLIPAMIEKMDRRIAEMEEAERIQDAA